MKKVIKKHPLAIRWFHWINFPVIAIMIWSGINGFIYVLYLIFSGEWRLIFPNKKSLKESFLVVLHDLHIRKAAPPQKKYNAAQRIAYTGVIVMGIGSLLTGLSIYKPIQFHTLCSLLGGYEWARAEHFILTILFTLFFVVHIVQVILAGWNNFRSMVTGLDVLPIANNILKPATISSGEDRHEAIPPVMKIAKSETIPNDAPADNVILEENNQVEKAGEPDSAGGFNDDHSAENDNSENQEEAGK